MVKVNVRKSGTYTVKGGVGVVRFTWLRVGGVYRGFYVF